MPNHDNIPIWEVDILVIGPISIRDRIIINTRKDLDNPYPFYSQVTISNLDIGLSANVTAFADNPILAKKAVILFLGRMLDSLSLTINLPLQLDLAQEVFIPKTQYNTRRILDEYDFRKAFNEARLLSLTETTFLRSLSWFRKGKYSQDPFDRFLAFWNSIETVASKYNPNKQNCKDKGTICHIWECFKTVWGECENWEFIGGQKKWIDNCNKQRKDIAHGIVPIEIDFVEKVVEKLEELENIAHKFLINWRESQLNPQLPNEL